MLLSLFLIVDNNTKSRLVAQSLVSDETVETYKWILECTKKATMTEPHWSNEGESCHGMS